MLSEITLAFSPNPSFYRCDLDNTWREGQGRVQTCKILQRVVVCSVDGSSRFDPLGYSSVLNSSKESPQATLCTRQTSFSSTSEKNITNECVLIRWNPSGTFGKTLCSISIMLYFYLPTHTEFFFLLPPFGYPMKAVQCRKRAVWCTYEGTKSQARGA